MPVARTGAGRIGAEATTRELMVLVAALQQEGDRLTPEAVQQRLGKTREEAEHLLYLVSTMMPDESASLTLPILIDDETGEITDAGGEGLRGRTLRLTRAETLAVKAALTQLGFAEDDPLVARLDDALALDELDEDVVSRMLAPVGAEEAAGIREALARAMAEGSAVEFDYRKAGSTAPERRHVRPERFEQNDGAWLLVGADLDRQAQRKFRLDRMSDVGKLTKGLSLCQPAADDGKESRSVTVTFDDPHWLELLPWHDLTPVKRRALTFTTPWYGGSWLPRMIAACGGHVTTDDAALLAAVRDLASSLLQ